MKFKKTPLFGQDSSPQNTSNILALCGTFLFWLIFVICMIFIKPNSQKPKYKEIQIILTQDFVAEKSDKNQKSEKSQIQKAQESKLQNEQQIQEQTAKVEEIIKTEQTPKIAEQKQEIANKPVQKETPKTQTQQKQPQPKQIQQKQETPPEPVEYAKSVDELMAEQFKPKAQTDEFNWDFFDEPFVEEEPQNSPQNSQPTVENVQSSFSGSAGIAAGEDSKPRTSENQKKAIPQESSEVTRSTLNSIARTNFQGNLSDGLTSQIDIPTEKGDDGSVKLKMSNGKTRSLWKPKEPNIPLTKTAANTIDGSKSVRITFTVTESGNVLPNSIKITPASMLPEIVRNEISKEISSWQFEPADYVAVAELVYNINKE